MTRTPAVAGQFYELDEERLKKQVSWCFTSDFGPKKLPKIKESKPAMLGAIVPHAGFVYSGPCAAFLYKELAESEKPDTFVILGPNHTGLGRTSLLLEDFATPFGIAKADKELGNALLKHAKIDHDPKVHLYEHSIEVQLPFLQFIYKNKFTFLPIVISSPAYLDTLARGLKEAAKECNKRICIIASSDFTHYGHHYGYTPFQANVRKRIEEGDNKAIEFIKKSDAEGFFSYVSKTGITICGFLPIYFLLLYASASKVELLRYYTSSDISGDETLSVSYASLALR